MMRRASVIFIIHIFVAAWIRGCIGQTTTTTATITTTTLATTTTIATTTPSPIRLLDSKNITWQPTSTEDIIIETDEGYKISATVTDCSIDGANREYVKLSTGKASETILMTYKLANSPSFFFDTNQVYANFTGSAASNLTIVFSRVGEPPTTTTTQQTTSTVFLPTPSINNTYELIVHLSGLAPYEYKNPETLMAFKEMIANMARGYSEDENFHLVDNITTDNVQIIEILRCTNGWPSCDPCIEARFAVPIHTDDDSNTWSGYQLNGEHLAIMWERYSQKYLTNGISNCVEPDINGWVKWQIVLFAGVTGIVLILLLLLRHYSIKYTTNAGISIRKMSDRDSIMAFEDRPSEASLRPHPLQDIPTLFDNTFPMYNPEIGSTNSGFDDYPGSQQKPKEPINLIDIDVEESNS